MSYQHQATGLFLNNRVGVICDPALATATMQVTFVRLYLAQRATLLDECNANTLLLPAARVPSMKKMESFSLNMLQALNPTGVSAAHRC